MANVLFVCVHNAGRSQMSEVLFRQQAGGRHQARSAGTRPAERVHPNVVDAMREVGIDLSHQQPQPLTNDAIAWAEVVVTMGCGDACPYIPGKTYSDWNLADPEGRPLAEVRAIRDEINSRVAALVAQLEARTVTGLG